MVRVRVGVTISAEVGVTVGRFKPSSVVEVYVLPVHDLAG